MFFLLVFCLVLTVPLAAGICALLALGHRPGRPQSPPVLIFHSVSGRPRACLSHIRTHAHEILLDRLTREHIVTTTLRNSIRPASTPREAPHQVVVLTYDDGFEDFYDNAFPALQARGMKATIFPIAAYVGKDSSWDVFGRRPHLSKDQLRAIAEAGHEIGSHTLTHPDLTLLSDDDLTRELADSRALLEDTTGMPVTSLSFPLGSWNQRVWRAAVRCGYTTATAYRFHHRARPPILPAHGVYAFDTTKDILNKVSPGAICTHAHAREVIMSEFAKGTTLWKFHAYYHATHLLGAAKS